MFGLDAARFQRAVNADPEFTRWARDWSSTVGLDFGSGGLLLTFRQGTLASAEFRQDVTAEIRLTAAEAAWREFLKPVPPPFFQGMLPAMVRQGFVLEGDAISWTAYYGALRRMFAIMRTLVHEANDATL